MGRRPPYEKFRGATCKGCYALGTACGSCEKCQWERDKANRWNLCLHDLLATDCKICNKLTQHINAAEPMKSPTEVRRYSVDICQPCIKLEGQECHTPGCIFFLLGMKQVAEYLNFLLIRPTIEGIRTEPLQRGETLPNNYQRKKEALKG